MGQNCINICICFTVSAFVLLVSGQVQNQPPTWDTTSINRFFQGFSEDTPVDTKLADLKCIDPDPGDVISYSLKSGKAVRVAGNGSVYLAVKLDFEAKDTLGYDLTFSCVDLDGKTGLPLHPEVETRLQISVDDSNDNPPTFEVNNLDGYSFSIREDAPVGTILTPPITIRDLDRTANARLDKLYLICNSNNPAEIATVTNSSKATCQHFRLDYIQISEGVYQANLSSTAPLDYEDRPVFSSKIIAIDAPGVTPQFTTTVNVQINLIDAQDTNPIFINPGASTTVSEGATIGSTVLNFAVSARDGDIGDKRAVALTLIGDPKNAFNLTTSRPSIVDGVYESQLVVKNQLDREALSGAYTIIVLATELDKVTNNLTTATATTTYSVFVSDINDNPPRFNNSVYVINVTEVQTANLNQTIQISGLHITCSDLDEPVNAHYRVTVVNQTFPAYSISPNVEFTGNASMFLKVDNPIYLDYDVPAYRQQTVVLVATEVGTKELFSGSTTIILNLVDINDNAPIFEYPSYTYDISENVSFYRFPPVTATDKDSGRNGQIKYRLDGQTDGKFTIDPDTGVITLNGTLNYDVTPEYVFLVYGTDQSELPRSSQVQVVVNVQNYNDKGPVFQLALYQTSVNESSVVFLTPVVIKAIDDDDPYPSNVTYRIVSGQSPNNAFVLDPYTGNLTLRQFLSYDDTPRDASGNRTGLFVLTVEASDNGKPPQTNTVQVRVSVIDENNHNPVLNPTLYNKTISEIAPAGTVVAQILGTDLDSGDFGKITYRVGAGQSDNFFVNPDTGLVTVNANSSFDYDVRTFYTLIIYATDGGAPQKTATGTVQITITDANNKNPVFRDPIYSREVDEKTAVGTVVITVPANDTDTNSSLSYSITSIIAYDRNGNRLTSTMPYDYQNAFGVRDQGAIYVKQALNKNLAQEIRFTLVARDINTQLGTGIGETQIALSITGQADTGITFDPINQVFMNEDALVNNNPITVTARDPNNNPVRNYIKISGSNNFRVDPVLGRVLLTTPIDYENDPEIDHLHRVIIRATSNDGNSTATGTATISIVDVNDNQPMFQTTTYDAIVSESALYPTEVISIYATDADSKSYGPLEFSISAGLGSEDFEIFTEAVPTGSLTSRRGHILVAKNKTLDFNRRGFYDLTLRVGDNQNLLYSTSRLYNSARLRITVMDENNNSPTFLEPSRTLYVPETAEIGSSIVTVIAIDADRGRNGEVVYNLEAVPNTSPTALQLFSIIPYIGTINVANSLIGLGGNNYSFLVRARDQGDIPNSGTMVVAIFILSTENDDGNPKWTSPSAGFMFTAPEETPNYTLKIGNETRFFQVNARRGDSKNITYELSPYGPYAKSFKINHLTGEITIIDSLDREIQETYNLLVYAIDMFNGTRYQTGRQFLVKLTDIDDNAVSFYNPRKYAACQTIDRPLVVYVQENTGANQTVFTLRACDPDGPGNNGIEYNLYNGNIYCSMQNNMSGLTVDKNGHLITLRIIDYEQDKEFKMCVKASSVQSVGRKRRSFDTSQVDQTLTDVAYIDVIIVDQDDNGPKFPKPTSSGVVQTEPGVSPVLELDAVDPDGSAFNDIIYRIESSSFYPQDGSPPVPLLGAFSLRGDKRALYPTLPSYADYAGGHFVLTVVAVDKSNSSLTDSQTVKIYVYKRGQALKIILDLPPSQGFNVSRGLVSQLDKVSSDYFFTYLQASEHRNQDGAATGQTDVCFLAVNSKSENILNIRDIASLLDESRYKDVWSKAEFKAVNRGQCYPSQSSEKNIKWRDLWWVLVALAIFLFVCCLILIVLICILFDRYKRYHTTQKSYLEAQ